MLKQLFSLSRLRQVAYFFLAVTFGLVFLRGPRLTPPPSIPPDLLESLLHPTPETPEAQPPDNSISFTHGNNSRPKESIHEHSDHDDKPNEEEAPKKKEKEHGNFCVAVLTAFPSNMARKFHVNRMLDQLNELPLPHNTSLDIHVFCDGNCSPLEHRNVHLHSLLAVIKTRLAKVLKSRRITEVYKMVLEQLFVQFRHKHCTILEDDLILAPDAFFVLKEGQHLLTIDPTVFTVSLFNDNSFPAFVTDQTVFKRVGHFAGLGFIMGRDKYITIRPYWHIAKVWDSFFQLQASKLGLVSVIPEIGRSMHLPDPSYGLNDTITTPKDSFQSQKIADVILPEYNFTNLVKSRYDQDLFDRISRATVLSEIDDACFENGRHFVYFGCNESVTHLSNILGKRSLWGKGNGNMVRGVYQGTLSISICQSSVTIVCRDSPFFAPSLMNQQLEVPTKGGQYRGLISYISRSYNLTLSGEGQDCHTTCQSQSRTCDISILYLLNLDCDMTRQVFPSCKSCKAIKIKKFKPYTGDMPAMLTNNNCDIGWPHFSSCFATAPGSRRICPCH